MVPVKQMAAGAAPQEFCTRLVTVGVLNFPWPSRKYEKRASFTAVDPSVQVWETLICCVRVAKSPREIAQVPARRLKLREGIQRVVVVKIIVSRQFWFLLMS